MRQRAHLVGQILRQGADIGAFAAPYRQLQQGRGELHNIDGMDGDVAGLAFNLA